MYLVEAVKDGQNFGCMLNFFLYVNFNQIYKASLFAVCFKYKEDYKGNVFSCRFDQGLGASRIFFNVNTKRQLKMEADNVYLTLRCG